MKVHIAIAKTESCDTYVFAFAEKPTRPQVIALVAKSEGEIEDMSWYDYTTNIQYFYEEVR
jgi:hypothetical protein